MPDDLTLPGGLVLPGAELAEEATLSGGPGGQHANKTETAVTVRWSIRDSAVLSEPQRALLLEALAPRLTGEGELLVTSRETRSQHQNRQIARERLAEIVAEALRPKRPRRPTRPTKASKERRMQGKRHRGKIKDLRGTPPHDD
jgi:ribosome-associated protein